MSTGTARMRATSLVFVALGVASAAPPADDGKSPPPAAAESRGDEGPTPETAGRLGPGIAVCTQCHEGPDKGRAPSFVTTYKSDEFVLLNESTTWGAKDIHAASLKTLTDPNGLGRKMEVRLKKSRPEGYAVAKAPECLACHSVDLAPAKPLADKNYSDFATAPGGVTCTLCHGLHQTWQVEHYAEPMQAGQPMPWRAKPPAEKWKRGMRDLRDPVVTARLCASCHVGSAAEGKVMTHEMYEAGHPALAPFELVSFFEGMPRHWDYPSEVKYFAGVKPADTWRLYHFHPQDKELYLARRAAVGAIAAVRAEAELIAADAEASLAKKGGGIDMARLDCYVCHYERNPGGATNRWLDNDTGRPPLRGAVGIPADVVARHAEGIEAGGLRAKADGFREKWDALKKAATARAFGDPAQVKAAARAMIAWCDAFLDVQSRCAEPLYPPAQARRLRELIAAEALGKSGLHPEAAMWFSWAYIELAKEQKVALGADALRQLELVIPPTVRTPPFSVQAGKRAVPQPGSPQVWMDKIRTFEPDKFADVFRRLSSK